MTPVLRISGLSYAYPNGVPALSGVSLDIDERERVALVGPNGSGKSTLLLVIAGCLRPASGQVLLQGEDVTGNPRKAGERTGLLFQNPDFQLLMPSVREELLLSMQERPLDGEAQEERIQAIARRLELDRLLALPPHRLSAGEKQLAALATLLILSPSLLLLDEPTAALDPQARRKLIGFLQNLETPFLCATHDLDLALETADRVLILDHGRIAADGPARTVLADQTLLAAHRLELPLRLQGPAR